MSLVKTSRTKKYPQLISTFIFEFKETKRLKNCVNKTRRAFVAQD